METIKLKKKERRLEKYKLINEFRRNKLNCKT